MVEAIGLIEWVRQEEERVVGLEVYGGAGHRWFPPNFSHAAR